MTVLIVGLGSIAKKHIKVLKQIDNEIQIFALRSDKKAKKYQDVINIYSIDELKKKPYFAIISNPTSEHYSTIESLLSLQIPFFIEKPVLMSLNEADKLLEEINNLNIITYVACNFRFHPCIQFLKDNIDSKHLNEVNIYSGSYLPEWRPDRDYRKVYSAKSEMGGGVHLDLIHEIDYTYWLWGMPVNINTTFRKMSELEINSYDYAHYILEYPQKMVHITLNYYRIESKRSLELVFEDDVWDVDLLNGSVNSLIENRMIFNSDYGSLSTYKNQMNYFFNVLNNKAELMNDFGESLEVLKICLNE